MSDSRRQAERSETKIVKRARCTNLIASERNLNTNFGQAPSVCARAEVSQTYSTRSRLYSTFDGVHLWHSTAAERGRRAMLVTACGPLARPVSSRCPGGQHYCGAAARLQRVGALSALGSLATPAVTCRASAAGGLLPLGRAPGSDQWQCRQSPSGASAGASSLLSALHSSQRGSGGVALYRSSRRHLRQGDQRHRHLGAPLIAACLLVPRTTPLTLLITGKSLLILSSD